MLRSISLFYSFLPLLLLLLLTIPIRGQDSQKVAVFVKSLPVALQQDSTASRTAVNELAAAARMHPWLIYHQLNYLEASYLQGKDSEAATEMLTQYRRHHAVQAQARWNWIYAQLQTLSYRVNNESEIQFIQTLQTELKADYPLTFATPEVLSPQQRNLRDHLAVQYLSRDPGSIYDPEQDYASRFKVAGAQQVQRLQEQYESQDSTSLGSTPDWAWRLFDNWYLFDRWGVSRFPGQTFNINDLFMRSLRQAANQPRSLLAATLASFGIDPNALNIPGFKSPLTKVSVFTRDRIVSLGISYPPVDIPLDLRLNFDQPEGSLVSQVEFAPFMVSTELGELLKLKNPKMRLSQFLLRAGLGYGRLSTDHETQIDTLLFIRETKSFDRYEHWSTHSRVSHFKTIFLAASVEAPLLFLGKHLSMGLGGRLGLAMLSYDHEYSLVYSYRNVYPNGTFMTSPSTAIPAASESCTDTSVMGLLYLAVVYQATDHFSLSSDISLDGAQLRLAYKR